MTIKTALLLDDNEFYRAMLTDLLEEERFRVKSFSEPIAFLNSTCGIHCHRQIPCSDVILTDNQMPGMTGLEFLEQLKIRGCKIPDRRKAIFSGTWSQDNINRAKQLGCLVFHKPGPLPEIYAWLNT